MKDFNKVLKTDEDFNGSYRFEPLNVIILGPQGSGKGTQGELLAKKFDMVFLGAGDLLREVAKIDTSLGREVHEIINVQGRHASADLVSRIFREKLIQIPKNQGVIVEGYPRNLEQYEIFKKFWDSLDRGDYKVLFIDLPEEIAIKRLSTRVVCENCGRIYVAGTLEKCSNCGGKLVIRPDDRPEAIKTRLELFNSLTLPMVAEMERDGRVIRIDGSKSVDEVHKLIVGKLNL